MSTKQCKWCRAPTVWAYILDGQGKLMRRGDDRGWKAVALDADPDPRGNVLLSHRPDVGWVATIFHRSGPLPPEGVELRREHVPACKGASRGRVLRAS